MEMPVGVMGRHFGGDRIAYPALSAQRHERTPRLDPCAVAASRGKMTNRVERALVLALGPSQPLGFVSLTSAARPSVALEVHENVRCRGVTTSVQAFVRSEARDRADRAD